MFFKFAEPTLRHPDNRNTIKSQIQSLIPSSSNLRDIKELIARVALPRGTYFGIGSDDENVELSGILSTYFVVNLPNLPSPPSVFCVVPRRSGGGITGGIELRGPNGTFSGHFANPHGPFAESRLFALGNIQELHLTYPMMKKSIPAALLPSYFPSLQTLIIIGRTNPLQALSTSSRDPASFLSLKTLGFMDCVISKQFMKALRRFDSRTST